VIARTAPETGSPRRPRRCLTRARWPAARSCSSAIDPKTVAARPGARYADAKAATAATGSASGAGSTGRLGDRPGRGRERRGELGDLNTVRVPGQHRLGEPELGGERRGDRGPVRAERSEGPDRIAELGGESRTRITRWTASSRPVIQSAALRPKVVGAIAGNLTGAARVPTRRVANDHLHSPRADSPGSGREPDGVDDRLLLGQAQR
jgi:hypothetical protein